MCVKAIMDPNQQTLEETLEYLDAQTGNNTSCVTLLVPAGANINTFKTLITG